MGSVDELLSGVSKAAPFFIPLHQVPATGPIRTWLDTPRPMRFEVGHLKVALGQAFDGVVFFRRVRSAEPASWGARSNDFEGCIAAHYLARTQTDEHERFRWNAGALARADASDPNLTRGFYPSLLLNLGRSREVLGNLGEARRFFQQAATRLDETPASPLGDMPRFGIAKALERVG